VNDSQDRLAALMWQHLLAMLLLYHGVSLLPSQATSPEAVALLRERGATSAYDEGEPDETAGAAARLAGERG
jgi:hypothetical protein